MGWHWRGARPDEVQLKDGTSLKGRLELASDMSVFGKLEEDVWGFVAGNQIRKLQLLSAKPQEPKRATEEK